MEIISDWQDKKKGSGEFTRDSTVTFGSRDAISKAFRIIANPWLRQTVLESLMRFAVVYSFRSSFIVTFSSSMVDSGLTSGVNYEPNTINASYLSLAVEGW